MTSSSIVVFAYSEVGLYCTQWLIDNHKSDLSFVVTVAKDDIYYLAERNGIDVHVFSGDDTYLRFCNLKSASIELGLLLWWPKIISPAIVSSAKMGFVNTHPSFLPYNRGKHYNFWAIVEQCPFGVSLHLVEKGIDCGPLVAQSRIDYTWEDTGESLYNKAIAAMKELFIDSYPRLRLKNFFTEPQNLSQGSFHLSSELEEASRINLDQPITPRHLLNLLRARTFDGYPACSFYDNGVEYEVRIKITKQNEL